MKLRHSLILPLLMLASPMLDAKHYQLFVLTGQSNSLGTTNGGEADPTSGSDPADQHVLFSWHNVVSATQSIGISGATLGTPTTTADFTTLQDQQGGIYPGSATHWGGEIEFARSLYRAGVRDFGVIKASRGGGGNTNWHKASGGHMYTHVVDTVAEAVASLDPADTYEIVGLMYLQGESDNASEAAAAGTRLKELTDNLRADLANASNLHTVAAGITTTSGNRATSIANQSAIATSTSYIDFFDNTDLAASGLAPDNLHLNKTGKTTVGKRWAQAFLNAGIVNRRYGNLVFIGDSITQGGNGDYPSYRYQVFKNLANAGVAQNAATGYQFVGSQTGPYLNSTLTTPDVNSQSFVNAHDGHFGWRVSWISDRVALPGGRYNTNNLGNGVLQNWLGLTTTYETANAGTLTYTGTTYTPDTAVIMGGINDLADGTAPTQVRDDISTMIDQLQAANPNVSIFLSQTLHTNQGATRQTQVDTLNPLLETLAGSKSTATSSVWFIESNFNFDPATMTYDNVHPNATGEEIVGDNISAALALIAPPTPQVTAAPIAERNSTDMGCFHFEGGDIYNSGSFASGWSSNGLTAIENGGTDIQIVHPDGSGRTLEGTSTGWSTINHTNWEFEARIKFNDITNGFAFWLGTGTNGAALIELQPGSTGDNDGNFSVAHNNEDGQFHTYRVTHDPANSVYHVWRDGVQITDPAGVPFDANLASTEARLLMGDYTGGAFGNNFDITIDYVKYCQCFDGNAIHNGTSYLNSWSSTGGVTPTIVNTDELQIVNTTAGGSWIEGTNTGWSDNSSENWTLEMRAKFNSVANGFAFYLETGSNGITVQVYPDRTQNGAGTLNKAHNNIDGEYHTFRIAHDANVGVYHVFRDGERLTDTAGVAYDSTINNSRMILGDTTGGTFGNAFDVTIDYIKVDYSGVWIPTGTDSDADGISDVWEDTHFNGVTDSDPSVDSDGDNVSNLDEFYANTDPNEQNSYFKVDSISEVSSDNFRVTVPNSSTDRVYTLQRNTTLTGTWTDIAGQGPFAGNGGDLHFDLADALSEDFFRVKVDLP